QLVVDGGSRLPETDDLEAVVGVRQLLLDDVRLDRHAEADRKSTRLNSSHLGSSYAVFCLKKKTWRRVGRPRVGQSFLLRNANCSSVRGTTESGDCRTSCDSLNRDSAFNSARVCSVPNGLP